jgi:hypothetical protein
MAGPKGSPKYGGRKKGSVNKPKIIKGVRELIPEEVMNGKTPKVILLEIMLRFYHQGEHYFKKLQESIEAKQGWMTVAEIVEMNDMVIKYNLAAAEIATKVAPYCHPKLVAIEDNRDDAGNEEKMVVRAPMVIENSEQWESMVNEINESGPIKQIEQIKLPNVNHMADELNKATNELKLNGWNQQSTNLAHISPQPLPQSQLQSQKNNSQDWLDAIANQEKSG